MCGIAGWLADGARVDPGLLIAMGDSLRHRGPEGSGTWTGPGVGLVHRRLAILDLTDSGSQPMRSHDGRWTITFNGEIYNHALLRSALEAISPRRWRGRSDTEVLVEAIAAFGVEQALRRCEGMFALAAWDSQERCLHLARDRFGEKPLYVGWVGGDIVFASELRALRMHPAWRHSVEPGALDWYFQVGYVPAPWSIHPGVYKLPAATSLRLTHEDLGLAPDVVEFTSRLRRFWSLSEEVAAARADPWTDSHGEAMSAVQEALDASVRSRMLADVPVGALLSGGIDSTLVVASMARQSAVPVRTFTVGFEAPEIDETDAALETARHWRTEHHHVLLPAGAALELVDDLPGIYDEPFADAAQLPAVLVSRAVREQVKVALTGDGGDEIFHGYQRYLDGARNWRWLGRIPAPVRRRLADACRLAASVARRGAAAERWRRQAGRAGAGDVEDYARALITFVGARRSLVPDRAAWPEVPASLRQASPGLQMRWLDQAFALPEGIHTKLDRASMSVGLELRVPFLDSRLFSLGWRLPEAWLASGGVGKRLLRELAKTQSPPGTAVRPKQGFDVPVSAWLRGPLRGWATDLLAPAALDADPLLESAYVSRLLTEHLERRADHGHALWAVLMYRSWCLRHG